MLFPLCSPFSIVPPPVHYLNALGNEKEGLLTRELSELELHERQ